MGAVLEGRFALVCGDETHELLAGDGIVIPPGEARAWRLLSERGVLYRVWRYADIGS
jgi:quercetin dioxygenase-like cupin family protein